MKRLALLILLLAGCTSARWTYCSSDGLTWAPCKRRPPCEPVLLSCSDVLCVYRGCNGSLIYAMRAMPEAQELAKCLEP